MSNGPRHDREDNKLFENNGPEQKNIIKIYIFFKPANLMYY